jgi:hypothetical protein
MIFVSLKNRINEYVLDPSGALLRSYTAVKRTTGEQMTFNLIMTKNSSS